MRDAFAKTIYELAQKDERICVLVADISPAGAMEEFRAEFPSRFFNVGVAEQAMIGLAAGMAQRGLRPFCYTIAAFALFRPYEFIRCDLAYQDLPVTVVGMGAGLSYPTLGGTHQAIEDVAVAMACPNLTVLAPCDPLEVAECVRWCAARDSGGPVYLRLGKAGEPDLTADAEPWKFGKMRWLRGGRARLNCEDTCIVTYGPAASTALRVAELLVSRGDWVSVACCSTLTQLDPEDLRMVERARRCVVIEEASGAPLASAIRGAVSRARSFALPSAFPHSYGTREELLAASGLTAEAIFAKL